MKNMTIPWLLAPQAPLPYDPLVMLKCILFYSLTTGRVCNRNHWTALPMPAEVIDRVHVLARRTIGAGAAGLAFTDRIGNPFIDDSSNNETYTPDTSDMNDNYDSDDDDTDMEKHPAASVLDTSIFDNFCDGLDSLL